MFSIVCETSVPTRPGSSPHTAPSAGARSWRARLTERAGNVGEHPQTPIMVADARSRRRQLGSASPRVVQYQGGTKKMRPTSGRSDQDPREVGTDDAGDDLSTPIFRREGGEAETERDRAPPAQPAPMRAHGLPSAASSRSGEGNSAAEQNSRRPT